MFSRLIERSRLTRPQELQEYCGRSFRALFQFDDTVVLSWPPQNGTADRQLVFVSSHLRGADCDAGRP